MVKCDFLGSALDLVLFNISFNILDDRMDMITHITIADSSLPRRVYVHWRTESKFKLILTNWRSGLEKIKCKRPSCEVICSRKNNQPHKCKLRDGCLSSTFSERRLEAPKRDSAISPGNSRQLAIRCDQKQRHKVIRSRWLGLARPLPRQDTAFRHLGSRRIETIWWQFWGERPDCSEG